MRLCIVFAFAFILASCNYLPGEPQQLSSIIIADVHWQNQGVSGITIVLVQMKDTVLTGPSGLAVFTVPAGNYTVRAFGINRGGPVELSVDFQVVTSEGQVAIVDIWDCLLCD